MSLVWSLRKSFAAGRSAQRATGRKRADDRLLGDRTRRCRFELMEERRMMDADPLKIGAVYIEQDGGSDLHGDTFEIKFEGGAAGTELKQLIIDGDQGATGRSVGDMIFDTIKGGWGADEAFNLQIVSQTGIQNVQWTVADGGTQLILNFEGFHAGDKLVFSIDVDEVQDYDPAVTNQTGINEGIDPIASGVEFQGSQLTAKFIAPHYHDVQGTGEYRNLYDPLFAGSGLLISGTNPTGLPFDDYLGQRDRSTGVMFPLQQQPLPVTIAGKVYLEHDLDLVQDAGEPGIANVTLSLWKKVGSSFVFTNHTTTTDAQGNYQFGLNLNLQPGVYQVRESQPADLFSVGAIPGTVSGTNTGSTVAGDPDILTEINIPFGDQHGIHYDFAEAQPASIRGRVHLTDREGNCFTQEALNRPLAGVVVKLFDAQGALIGQTLTNANGQYEFLNLRPGTYTVVEQTPPGLIDGGDHVGTVGGIAVGQKTANDTLSSIFLGGGAAGINYDFCEHEPSDISGFVYHDANNNGVRDAGEAPIPGTTVILLDAGGTQVGTQTTDSAGFYKFTGLSKGVYCVVEVQPGGWIDGKDAAGTIFGQVVGTAVNPGDKLKDITLLWGDSGVNYDFGEVKPGSLSGHVFVDDDRDCLFDATESPIGGVTIQLFDSQGTLIATTQTNSEGFYRFDNLLPGTYIVKEQQPAGYLQGGQKAGSAGGNDSVQDVLSQVPLGSGDALTDYDFCELLPVSIEGLVFADIIPNCLFDPGETPLAGVTIRLFDASGNQVGITQTNALGRYKFDNLLPGTYTVKEEQPAGYLDSDDMIGSHGGNSSVNDTLASVVLKSGDEATEYNFCETPPATLSGFVFRDGQAIHSQNGQVPANLYDLRDGKLTADDLRIGGVWLELRDTLSGELIRGEDVLPGIYPAGPIRVRTDANGYYEFTGLPAGNYSVFEVQPEGYIDSLDTPGTTNGLAVNQNTTVTPFLVQTFALQGVSFRFDAILQVPLAAGQHSAHNNFSEVQIFQIIIPPDPPRELPPPVPPAVVPQLPIEFAPPQIFIPPPVPDIITGGGGNYTWHLSIIDAGTPRISARSTRTQEATFRPAMWVDRAEWQSDRLGDGIWTIQNDEAGVNAPHYLFGLPGAIPVTGDWNGDGRAKLGIYYKGEWFLDLNGNGRWDEGDLWAKLGTAADLPVVGDWDGDGKDDIGIFGPEWPGDPRHIENEPGLPDPDNMLRKKPKNLPPSEDEATDGERLLRLTAQGKERADLIDHVFQFGGSSDIPIAGDWNGDGITSIGVYREGKWHFDMDGDGRWSAGDKIAQFGLKGDLPVVGDYDGDGIDEIGIYRAGNWIIDSNGNREIDDADKAFTLGTAADQPVTGDFNGDGIDEPALYREGDATPQAE